MSTRRFIAGAVCPKCAEMDKTVMYTDGEHSVRECVRCGFKELMDENGPVANPLDEVTTRVNQPVPGEKPLAHEEEVQIINLMDLQASANERKDH
jgi:hypothetical protein